MESTVVRLTHCQRHIFCFSVPERCPSCGGPLKGGRLLEAPVSLPNPFSNAHNSPCCLLVAPAAGSLNRNPADTHERQERPWKGREGTCRTALREGESAEPESEWEESAEPGSDEENLQNQAQRRSDFDGETELHTGISSTTGVVYNYTDSGVRRDLIGWERCVCVPLVRPDMFHLLAQWDQYLDHFSQQPMWDPAWHRFDEDDHNCFTFCLHFLNGVLTAERLTAERHGAMSRDDFTRTFILPRMRRVSKYTFLYQHIQKHGFYLADRQDPTS